MSDSPRRFRACLLEKSEIFSQLSTADQRIRTAYAFRVAATVILALARRDGLCPLRRTAPRFTLFRTVRSPRR